MTSGVPAHPVATPSAITRMLAAAAVLMAVLGLALMARDEALDGSSPVEKLASAIAFYTVFASVLGIVEHAMIAIGRPVRLRSLRYGQANVALMLMLLLSMSQDIVMGTVLANSPGVLICHIGVPVLACAIWLRVRQTLDHDRVGIVQMVMPSILYMIYVLSRGVATGLYPYDWMDATRVGVLPMIRNLAFATTEAILLAALFITFSGRRARAVATDTMGALRRV